MAKVHTKARLVATSNQHPPLLGGSGARLDGSVQGVLPVGEREALNLLALYRAAGRRLGVGDNGLLLRNLGGLGNGGSTTGSASEAPEEVLELGLVLVERTFGGSQKRQCQDGGGGREAHCVWTVDENREAGRRMKWYRRIHKRKREENQMSSCLFILLAPMM